MTVHDPAARTTARTLGQLRGGLVVSCQARPGEPLHGPAHMVAMALSVLGGGAVGLRVEGLADVQAVSAVVDVPVIGLCKVGHEGVYITPTVADAVAVARAGADVVAVDATDRPRPDGSTLAEVVRAVHDEGRLLLADVATCAEGVAAVAAGADAVSTTLAGYTGPGEVPEGPDLELVSALSRAVAVPVLAEGRIRTPAEASDALARGAWAVVVGSAITRPGTIAAGFSGALAAGRADR
jgi:N-acylglucosamine-6-phosphate 2-epimerase